MTIAAFDHLDKEEKKKLLYTCCGSDQWVNYMLDLLPFEDLVDVLEDAEQVWYHCDESGWLQAFDHHPKIGDITSLKTKFGTTADLASNEQAGVTSANDETLIELAELNHQYEKKNGFIFIICATGKPAAEILAQIKKRINHNRETELEIAAEEQNRITKLRLEKLFI